MAPGSLTTARRIPCSAAAGAHRPPSDPQARAAAEQALVAFIAGKEVALREGA